MRYKTLEDIINETKYPQPEAKKEEPKEEKKVEIKEEPINMQVEYKSKDGVVLIKGDVQDSSPTAQVEDIEIMKKKIIIEEMISDMEDTPEDDITPKTK